MSMGQNPKVFPSPNPVAEKSNTRSRRGSLFSRERASLSSIPKRMTMASNDPPQRMIN